MLLWIRNLNFKGGVAEISAFGKLLTVPAGVVNLIVPAGVVKVGPPQ